MIKILPFYSMYLLNFLSTYNYLYRLYKKILDNEEITTLKAYIDKSKLSLGYNH